MLTNLFESLGTNIQNAIHDMGNNIKGKAAIIAIEKLEKRLDGREHGKAIQDMIWRKFPNGHFNGMKDDMVNYLLEMGEGIYTDDEDAYAKALITYANSIKRSAK